MQWSHVHCTWSDTSGHRLESSQKGAGPWEIERLEKYRLLLAED